MDDDSAHLIYSDIVSTFLIMQNQVMTPPCVIYSCMFKYFNDPTHLNNILPSRSCIIGDGSAHLINCLM